MTDPTAADSGHFEIAGPAAARIRGTRWAGPEYLRQQAEMSLYGLGVGRIDLFHLHRIDPKVPLSDQEAARPGSP